MAQPEGISGIICIFECKYAQFAHKLVEESIYFIRTMYTETCLLTRLEEDKMEDLENTPSFFEDIHQLRAGNTSRERITRE